MTARKLDKKEWQAFFDRISKLLEGKRAEIEVASLALGDQVEAEWLPLLGIVYDRKGDLVEVALDGLDHMIRKPREIYVDVDGEGLLSLEIVDAEEPPLRIFFGDGPLSIATRDYESRLADGPVVAEPAVRAMAERAAEMFGADIVVAVSGAGGPDPQDDQPPGTVWFAVADRGTTDTWQRQFPGEPPDVLKATRIEALHALRERVTA